MNFYYKLALGLLFCCTSLQANFCQQLYVGPEFYHMLRQRDGGAQQSGYLVGGRIGYDRLKPGSWYIGGDYLYASGNIQGHSGSQASLLSDITDTNIEGRIGFNFFIPHKKCYFFTPFAGYGYFREVNDFHSPSPIPFKFTDTFDYVVAGFLSGFNFTPLISMGLNFKLRFMLSGESKVTDDPLFDDQNLIMNNEIQTRLEIPVTFRLFSQRSPYLVAVVPFYEFRHFGGREDYPFDFLDTKFNLIGARISVSCYF